MGDSGLRFHVAGFPVSLPLGGILGVLLIAYLWAPTFAGPAGDGLLLAGVFAVLLYVAVLVHELAHAWAARAFGYPVHGITLWLLGGYTVYERRDSRPWPELVISVVGPLSTLMIAGGCWLLESALTGAAATLAGALAWTNLLLGVLNLLPGAPLDGGGLVKAVVWRLSGSETVGARAAGYAGLVVAGLLVLLTVWAALNGAGFLFLTLLLAAFIGFGAYQAVRTAGAGSSWRALAGNVAHMLRPLLAVSDQELLGPALQRWDRSVQVAVVTVDAQGRLLAALSAEAAAAVPPEHRSSVGVAPFTRAIPTAQRAVLADDPLAPVHALAQSGEPLVFVTDADGRPLGVLTARDVNAALGSSTT